MDELKTTTALDAHKSWLAMSNLIFFMWPRAFHVSGTIKMSAREAVDSRAVQAKLHTDLACTQAQYYILENIFQSQHFPGKLRKMENTEDQSNDAGLL